MNIYAQSVWSKSSLGFFGGVVAAVVVLAFALSCGNTLPKIPTFQEAQAQAEKEVPAHIPAETKLFDAGVVIEKEIVLNKGELAPVPGIFMRTPRYAEVKAISIDRNLLIAKYRAESVSARTKEIILNAATNKLQEMAKRSWFEKNSLVIGLVLGAVLGVALTVGLVYGLTGG